MLSDEQITLSKFRMEKAEECQSSAQHLFDIKDFSAAVNRSYYAIFHAIRAIMALDCEDRKKHSGVIAYFQEHYIKTGIFEKRFSYLIKSAFDFRQESDYEDFCTISENDAVEQVTNAFEFLETVKRYLIKRYDE